MTTKRFMGKTVSTKTIKSTSNAGIQSAAAQTVKESRFLIAAITQMTQESLLPATTAPEKSKKKHHSHTDARGK